VPAVRLATTRILRVAASIFFPLAAEVTRIVANAVAAVNAVAPVLRGPTAYPFRAPPGLVSIRPATIVERRQAHTGFARAGCSCAACPHPAVPFGDSRPCAAVIGRAVRIRFTSYSPGHRASILAPAATGAGYMTSGA
jgi:hypothetical protein